MEFIKTVRTLLDEAGIRSVSCSIGDSELWSMLIAEQLYRANQHRINPQHALALMGPGWDTPDNRIRIGTGRVHLPDSGVCVADLLILHKSFGIRAIRSKENGSTRLPLLQRCRYLLIKKDFGEVENAAKSHIGYWTLYRSLEASEPFDTADSFVLLPGSETTVPAGLSPLGLALQSTYDEERGILDNLIRDAQIYQTTTAYRQLVDFVVRFRHMAPYNAMLLNVQRPGLKYATTKDDWAQRYGRYPKRAARPLLILKAFGPVEFVYDLLDTDGREVPVDAFSYPATGPVSQWQISRMLALMARQGIRVDMIEAGDEFAGTLSVERSGDAIHYRMEVNRNHILATQFVTLAHELAHLYLGHLGENRRLDVRERKGRAYAQVEVEAESAAYLVCRRNGIDVRSETYLQHFADAAGEIDIYVIMRAVGQIEKLLELGDKEALAPLGQGELGI